MMGHPADCDIIYGDTAEGVQAFYNDRAPYYDNFLEETGYVLHTAVAEHAAQRFGDVAGRVVDLGCGTGRVGLALKLLKPLVSIDGLDYSPSMIERANRLNIYKYFYNINIKTNLNDINETYDLLLSAGAFTPSHLNADDLINSLSLVHSGGLAVVSVKKDWFDSEGFQDKIDQALTDSVISSPAYSEVLIWDHNDYTDTAVVVSFIKL